MTAPSSSLNSACSVSSLRRVADLRGPVLRVAVLGAAVGNAVAFGHQQVDVEAHADVSGERHLAHRGPQAAVAAVVVREQLAVIAQPVDRRDERDFSRRGVVEVGHDVAELAQHLRQHRAAHAMRACAEVDEDQRRVARLQLRRQRAAHVVERRERRDDQADRRRHLLRTCAVVAVVPARAHRQRILADRNADAERRAQLHADRAARCRTAQRLRRVRRTPPSSCS